tara:strand:- start:1204 stop:1425 length:222 start_codon:yes stop_codon:yes gene_type:complete
MKMENGFKMRIELKMVRLDSVGCGLDTLSNTVYPSLRWGGYDFDNGSHLDDCCDEWFNALSKEDMQEVKIAGQ